MIKQFKILDVRKGDYHRIRSLFIMALPYNEVTKLLQDSTLNIFKYRDEMITIIEPFSHDENKSLYLTGHSSMPLIINDNQYILRNIDAEIPMVVHSKVEKIIIKTALVDIELSKQARKRVSLIKRFLNIFSRTI